jgi:hypothetical protein
MLRGPKAGHGLGVAGGAMPDYRLYTVTSGGRIHGVPTVISCVDDQEATEKARQLAQDEAIDVWERDRRVARVSPNASRWAGFKNFRPDTTTTPLQPAVVPEPSDPLTLAVKEVFGDDTSEAKIERVRELLTAHGAEINVRR